MTARISRPAKTAMQSGKAKSDRWLLEFVPEYPGQVDPLMGWSGTVDMQTQVKLWFASRDEAIAYAARHGIAAQVEEPQDAKRRVMSYSDNFKCNRIGSWTH
ncbi:MAG: ETC complex I subunit [Alphaproteobacteria bacterium]|nr:ETC complex I subunit [Alphaproteobacteria bacterium]